MSLSSCGAAVTTLHCFISKWEFCSVHSRQDYFRPQQPRKADGKQHAVCCGAASTNIHEDTELHSLVSQPGFNYTVFHLDYTYDHSVWMYFMKAFILKCDAVKCSFFFFASLTYQCGVPLSLGHMQMTTHTIGQTKKNPISST